MTLTKPHIEALMKLESEATEGPWFTTEEFGICHGSQTDERNQYSIDDPNDDPFIAQFRNAAPELLALALEALESRQVLNLISEGAFPDGIFKGTAERYSRCMELAYDHLKKFGVTE